MRGSDVGTTSWPPYSAGDRQAKSETGTDPSIELVQLRNAEAGCFVARVVRA